MDEKIIDFLDIVLKNVTKSLVYIIEGHCYFVEDIAKMDRNRLQEYPGY